MPRKEAHRSRHPHRHPDPDRPPPRHRLGEGDRVLPRVVTCMPVTRMNHAVLYVRDVARTVAFYEAVLEFRVVAAFPGQAAFLQAPGSSNDHDLGLFQIRAGGWGFGCRSAHGRPVPHRLGGRRPRRAGPAGAQVDRGREPCRCQRSRDHEGPLRQGPGRTRVRGVLARACLGASRPVRLADAPARHRRREAGLGGPDRGRRSASVPAGLRQRASPWESLTAGRGRRDSLAYRGTPV